MSSIIVFRQCINDAFWYHCCQFCFLYMMAYENVTVYFCLLIAVSLSEWIKI